MGRRAVLIASLAALLGAGCDNSVDPFVESDELSVAVVGYLDMGADTQFVRVDAVRPDGSDGPVETAAVTSFRLGGGVPTVWADSAVTLTDGSAGVLYFAAFVPKPGAAYQLEIRTDGAAPLHAYTRVPSRPDVTIFDADATGDEVSQRVLWTGIFEPDEVVVVYRLRVGPGAVPAEVRIRYDRRSFSSPGNELEVLIPFNRDLVRIREELAAPFGDESIALDHLEMQVRVLSEDWSDGAPDNIDHGEGFFASIGEFSASWTIADTLAHSIGYAPSP